MIELRSVNPSPPVHHPVVVDLTAQPVEPSRKSASARRPEGYLHNGSTEREQARADVSIDAVHPDAAGSRPEPQDALLEVTEEGRDDSKVVNVSNGVEGGSSGSVAPSTEWPSSGSLIAVLSTFSQGQGPLLTPLAPEVRRDLAVPSDVQDIERVVGDMVRQHASRKLLAKIQVWRSEIRAWRSEIRVWRSEIRAWSSEIRPRRSEIRARRSDT